jgi:hypothetical protein
MYHGDRLLLDIALVHPVPSFSLKYKNPPSMLFRALFFAPLPLLAFGVNIRRQDNTTQTPTTTVPPVGVTTGTGPTTSLSPPPDVPFTLVSSNPTAFPLSDIVASPSTHPTEPLETTPTAGEEPTAITGNAPPLPTGLFLLFPSIPVFFWLGDPCGAIFVSGQLPLLAPSVPAVLPNSNSKLTLASFLIVSLQ